MESPQTKKRAIDNKQPTLSRTWARDCKCKWRHSMVASPQWLISDLKNIKFNIFRTQLCINTAIVYMQRFYMFHSFSRFHRNSIAAAALFLAAKVRVMILVMTFKQKFNFWFQEGKWWISGWTICSLQVEEQPRKLEHVIKVSHVCLNRSDPHLDSKSEKYLELVSSEKWRKWNIKYFLCFRPKS